MAKLYNIARMTTATTGTGTITLGSAVSGFLTFAQAGVANGETVSYGIKDGSNTEVGTGTYTTSGTTLSRSVVKSTNSDSAISLSGSAEVYITALKADILSVSETQTANTRLSGPTSGGAATPTFRALVTDDIANTIVTEAKLSLSDVTTANVSTSAHGFCPKLPNTSAEVLKGSGAFAGPEWVLLTSGTISNSATSVDVVLTSYTAYRAIKFFLLSAVPATDNNSLNVRTSTDGGSTFAASAGNYRYGGRVMNDGGSGAGSGGSSAQITTTNSGLVGNQASEGINIEITLFDQTNTAKNTKVAGIGNYMSAAGTPQAGWYIFGGFRTAAQDTDALRMLWASGNYHASSPGKYAVYGLK